MARKEKQDDVQKVAEGVLDDVKMGVDDSHLQLHTMMTQAVGLLGQSCVPCRRPCARIKLLKLIDHRRVGSYGLCRRKRALNTLEATAETLIVHVEDDQRIT